MSDDTEKETPFDLRDAHVYGGIIAAAAGLGLWVHIGAGLLVLGLSLAGLGLRRGG